MAGRAAGTVRVSSATGERLEVRQVHPFQASKAYVCPGCNNEIAKGQGHVVVVPLARVDDRRHWHHPCWTRAH